MICVEKKQESFLHPPFDERKRHSRKLIGKLGDMVSGFVPIRVREGGDDKFQIEFERKNKE